MVRAISVGPDVSQLVGSLGSRINEQEERVSDRLQRNEVVASEWLLRIANGLSSL